MRRHCIDCGAEMTTTTVQKKRCGNVKEKTGCAYKRYRERMAQWRIDNREHYLKYTRERYKKLYGPGGKAWQ